jgi:hypothetical protein
VFGPSKYYRGRAGAGVIASTDRLEFQQVTCAKIFLGIVDTAANCGISSISVVANTNAGSPRGVTLAPFISVLQLAVREVRATARDRAGRA